MERGGRVWERTQHPTNLPFEHLGGVGLTNMKSDGPLREPKKGGKRDLLHHIRSNSASEIWPGLSEGKARPEPKGTCNWKKKS